MALITVLSRNPDVVAAVEHFRPVAPVTVARGWERMEALVLTRPVTDVIFDGASFERSDDVGRLLADFHQDFPSVGLTYVDHGQLDGQNFLTAGLIGREGLSFGSYGDVRAGVRQGLTRSAIRSPTGMLLRAVGNRTPRFGRETLRAAMFAATLGWPSDRFARHVGYTRPHLSSLLRATRLPSPGQLLTWAKLLHAGHWLCDPGRTGQSVAAQLDYANGATFRRALRTYVGLTPTQVVALGGFDAVCRVFLDVTGLADSVEDGLSAA
ncbi:MAG: helix-turn-helix domain-containing protein [Gemmatimonadota bacterium]